MAMEPHLARSRDVGRISILTKFEITFYLFIGPYSTYYCCSPLLGCTLTSVVTRLAFGTFSVPSGGSRRRLLSKYAQMAESYDPLGHWRGIVGLTRVSRIQLTHRKRKARIGPALLQVHWHVAPDPCCCCCLA
jgi:hypothetical protein